MAINGFWVIARKVWNGLTVDEEGEILELIKEIDEEEEGIDEEKIREDVDKGIEEWGIKEGIEVVKVRILFPKSPNCC